MVSMIVAMCKNRGVGNSNSLPWNIPEDLKYFKKMTLGHPCVMGRKAFVSIGRPLPNRLNIVITTSPEKFQNSDNVKYVTLNECEKILYDHPDAFIIGGSTIYSHFLDKVDTLYVTNIHKMFDCDTRFPRFLELFELASVSDDHYSKNEECYFNFETYRQIDVKN
jgi:dihydrofolate reductase